MSAKALCFFAPCLLAALLLLGGPPFRRGQAADPPKPEERLSLLEKRLAEMEKKIAELQQALKDRPARHQMLNAGRIVVILDTHTGKHRLVEPEENEFITVGNTLWR